MAHSAEWKQMQQELKSLVVPVLRGEGFKGSFPHFRREKDGKFELISFLAHNQWGGAFEAGASVLFTHAPSPDETNLFFPSEPFSPGKLNWAYGRIRSGLPGMYSGVFYYADVYRWKLPLPESCGEHYHYTAVTPVQEKYLLDHLRANHYELVLKADANSYREAASRVLQQLPGLLSWFDEMKTYQDLAAWQVRQDAGRGPLCHDL